MIRRLKIISISRMSLKNKITFKLSDVAFSLFPPQGTLPFYSVRASLSSINVKQQQKKNAERCGKLQTALFPFHRMFARLRHDTGREINRAEQRRTHNNTAPGAGSDLYLRRGICEW